VVSVAQGDVWWAGLKKPTGSGPGLKHPVIVIQGDALNRSAITTVVCVPLTSNLKWAGAPGNVFLKSRFTGLPKDSVANVSQLLSIDRTLLLERTGHIPKPKIELILSGIDVVLGR
jgi:mRNA interferase MazF